MSHKTHVAMIDASIAGAKAQIEVLEEYVEEEDLSDGERRKVESQILDLEDRIERHEETLSFI